MKPKYFHLELKSTFLLFILSLFSLTSLAHGDCDAGNFAGGFSTPGTFAPDVLRGVKYTVNNQGTITNLCLKGLGTNAQVRMALYTNNGGVPGTLVVESVVGTVAPPIVGTDTAIFLSTPATFITPGDYWLMAVYDNSGSSNSHSYATVTTTQVAYETPLTFGSTMPANGAGFTNAGVIDFEYWIEIACCATDRVENVTACDSYLHPDGNTYTVSNSYPYTIPVTNGCDSTVYVNVTIIHSSTNSFSITTCDEYTTPSGQSITTSGTYNDTIPNAAGCDSVLTITATILHSTTSSLTIVEPNGSYTAPSGTIYTSSGVYVDTLINSIGCDSLITINLTLPPPTTSSISATSCYSYTAPSGAVYAATGTYSDTIANAAGGDSIISIALTINGSSFFSTAVYSCGDYTSPSGNTYTSDGIYKDTISNYLGCDSIITTMLTIVSGSSSSSNITACDSFTSSLGMVYNTSGIYTETLSTIHGCDSVVTINLTITQSTTNTIIDTISGGSYTAPSGAIYTSTGSYSDTIPNSIGCDSIISLIITLPGTTFSYLTESSCYYYIAPDGDSLIYSGNYLDTLVNANGGDSIVSIALTINRTTYDTISPVTCTDYLSPAGHTYTTSGNYTDTISNSFGCDSVISINLTILSNYVTSVNISNCGDYTSPVGNIYTQNGTYQDTLTSIFGCDSIIVTNLQIVNDTSLVIIIDNCGPYTSGAGNIYTASGNYTENLTNINGCDSTVLLKLAIHSLNTTLISSGGTLTSQQPNATYQWLDCGNNYAVISGETNQDFTPTQNGNYAAIITTTNCTDTTNCIPMAGVGITTLMEDSFSLFPNPFSTEFSIQNRNTLRASITINVYSISGQLIYNQSFNAENITINTNSWSSGIYTLQLTTTNGVFVKKIIKN